MLVLEKVRSAALQKVLFVSNNAHAAESSTSVLVVDDDRWTTRAVVHALSADPEILPCDPVHEGAAALEAYREQRPDVVLMDLNMPPGMGGVEAISAIRRFDPAARVVVLTTVAPGPGIARAIDAGALAVLNKTASEEALRSTVKAAACGDESALVRGLAGDIIVSGDVLPGAPITAPRLTSAEYQTLLHVCGGSGYDEIAAAQRISVWTAKSHVKKLREKLEAENLAQLVVRALQFNFFSG